MHNREDDIMTSDERMKQIEESVHEVHTEVRELKLALLGDPKYGTRGILDGVRQNQDEIKIIKERVDRLEQIERDARRFWGLFGVRDLTSLIALASVMFALGRGFGWW